MPTVTCRCGRSYNLKDEYAGKVVQCPNCAEKFRVPAPAAAVAVAEPQADPAFDRDLFLLRQKHLSLNEKYLVWDEQGQAILFVERPTHWGKGCLALMATIGAAFVLLMLGIGLPLLLPDGPAQAVGMLVGVVIALVGTIAVAVVTFPKRHVTFYRDESKQERLLEVFQDAKWQLPIATYTIAAPDGEVLAKLRKNYLYNFFRKKWDCARPDGSALCTVREDSIILSLLRRLLGPMFGLLRTNFIIQAGASDRVIGEFNRKFTLLDRYSLDMKADPSRSLDRRVALAIGVMLDTGERR